MSGRYQAIVVDDEDDEDDDEFLLTPRTRDRFGQGYSQYLEHRSERPSYPAHRPSRPHQRPPVSHYSQQVPHGSCYALPQSHNEYHSQRSHESHYRQKQPYRDNYNRDRSYDSQYSHNNHHSQDNHYSHDRHYPQDTHYSQHSSYERYHHEQRRDYEPHQSDRSSSTNRSPHSRLKEIGRKELNSDRRQNKPDLPHTLAKGPQATGKGGWLTTSPEKHNKGSSDRDKFSHIQADQVSGVSSSMQRSDSLKSGDHRNIEKHKSLSDNRNDQSTEKEKVSPKSEALYDTKAGFKKSVSELLTEKENRSAKKIKKRLSSEKHEESANVKQEREKTREPDKGKTHEPDKQRESKSVHDSAKEFNETPAPDKTDRDKSGLSESKETGISNEKEKQSDKTTENLGKTLENESKHKREASDNSRKSSEGISVVKKLIFQKKSKENTEKSVVDKQKQSSINSRDSSREKESKSVERKISDKTKFTKNNPVDNKPAQKSRKDEKNDSFLKNERKGVFSKIAIITEGESNKKSSSMASSSKNKQDRNQPEEKHAAPNVTISGTQYFAGVRAKYFAGVKAKSQVESNSIDRVVVLTSEKEQMKMPKKSSTDNIKNKKSQPTLTRQISNSSNTSVESGKTNSSGKGYVSCSRSDRKTSSEMSTFDFAGDIFQDSVSKPEIKASKSGNDKLSVVAKVVSETPAEQLKDNLKSHKKMGPEEVDSRNEHDKLKQKKMAVVGSDSSGSEAEFEHFKNILTQVHDSRWKTKPLLNDSRRSSTQSYKSTDSSASVSLLNQPREKKILSQKAYKKFGVRNVEYRRKKIYYKGIKIKQPVVFIKEKDIRNVIKHKKMLKLRKKLDKADKSKFKKIRRIRSSSSESEIRESDKSCKSVIDSDAGLSSTSDRVKRDKKANKNDNFSWIIPDSYENSDTSQMLSDQRKKSCKHDSVSKRKESEKDEHRKSKDKHHKSHKTLVSPPKKKEGSGVSNSKTEEKDNVKRKKESSRVKTSSIVSKTKKERVPGCNKKETKQSTTDSDFETQPAAQVKTDSSSSSSSDESLSESEHKRKIHGDFNERKETAKKKTQISSSPIFRHKVHKAKSKLKSPETRCKSSSSDSESEMQNQTVMNDMDKSAIIQETESSNSSSDILAKNDGVCDRLKLSLAVKPCEIPLTKIDDKIEAKLVGQKDARTKKTTEEPVKDLTEIPETQMSPSSSSSDLPIFKDSPIESDNDKTIIACDKNVHNINDNDADSIDKAERNEYKNSKLSTQETQVYSCGEPVLTAENMSQTKSVKIQLSDSVTKDNSPKEGGVTTEDKTDEFNETDNKSQNVLEGPSKQCDNTVSVSTDNEQIDPSKPNPLKKCLSPQDKLKQNFRSFQTKVMKYQQKQRKERKLKSKIITKKLRDRGLLSDKDETGDEGDVEDNLMIESLSDSDDSDLETQTGNKNKNIEKEISSQIQNNFLKGNVKHDVNVREDSPTLNIQSMSENENSDKSILSEPREDNRTLVSPSHNKSSEPQTNETAAHNEPELNGMEPKVSDVKIKEERGNDKDDDVRYESFTSSCSQSSSNSDGETEKEKVENVVVLDKEEIKTEQEEINTSNVVAYRRMSSHGNEIDINQSLSRNDSSNEPELKGTKRNENEESNRLPNLSFDQNNRIKQENIEVERESKSNMNVDKVKEEPVQIKEEPDWSKFSYTQEPDAIFVSDSEDNGIEIMSAQNETILVNSDSDNDNTLANSQSAHESQVLDPEFWDFSSPEICSSSEDEVKPGNKSKTYDSSKSSPSASTSNLIVKPEKEEIVGNPEVLKDEDSTLDTAVEKITEAAEKDNVEESYSGSESSYDESEYVEIGSSDSEGDSTLKSVEMLGNGPSSPQSISSERQSNTSVSESYTTSTVKDSFDPYSVGTQIDENLPSNNRVKAISEATKTKLKPHLNYLHESSSETESSCDISTKNSDKSRKEFAYVDLYEAYTQVDESDQHEAIKREHDSTYQEAVQVSTEEETCQKVSEYGVLDNSDSLSDSSLVDAADNQIKLYEQSRKYLQKTKIVSAAGLTIRCDKNVFASNKVVNKIKKSKQDESRVSEPPFSNQTVDTVNDWYSTMTQVDSLNDGKESSVSTYKGNVGKSLENAYAVLTQNSSFVLNDSADEINYSDDQIQSSLDNNKIQSNENVKSRKDIYSMATQLDTEMQSTDDSDSHTDGNESRWKVEPKGTDEKTTDEDEYAAYGALTQVDNGAFDINSEKESEKEDEIDAYADMTQVDHKTSRPRGSDDKLQRKSKVEDDYYSALTQKDTYIFSSDSDNEEYNSAKKQVDKNIKNKPVVHEEPRNNIYGMETQIDYESQGTTDISLISVTDSDHADVRNKTEKSIETVSHKQNEANLHKTDGGHAAAVNLDTASCSSVTDSNKDDQANKLNSIKDKLKLSLNKKKTIEIPMQKVKSWKVARQISVPSSVVKCSSKRNDSSRDNALESGGKNVPAAAPKQPSSVSKPLDDIAFYNAKKSDMWLSKNVSKSMKTPPKPPGKRKRRATGEAEKAACFTSAIQEARKRLADRNYHTVLHPESKADPQKKPKLDIPSELEDVDLPTCSQIVSKGLPVLNPTGLLVKKNKPQQQVSSRFSSRAASLTETMVEAGMDPAKSSTSEAMSKHQTAETGSSSAFEFLEKEICNLKPVGSDKGEKDKISDEKVEDAGKQRKRRLSTVSQNSEYMPEPKTCKKLTGADTESIPGASEKPSAIEQSTFRNNSGASEKPHVSKQKTDRNSSTDRNSKQTDTGSQIVSSSNKTVEKAAKITDITNVPSEKSPETKSKPVWNASSVEKQTQKKAESTGAEKAKKKVTFGENIRIPNKETSRGPNTSQKPQAKTNVRDPRQTQVTANKPNLMLKTPLQSSDALRVVQQAGTTHPQSRQPPQPFQRQNQVPAPATTLSHQETGITFKEFLAVMLRWNPVWFEEHANHLERDRNAEPPNCINGLPGDPTLYPLTEKYSSFKEYSNNFMIPLLLYETWESSFQTWREKRGRNNVTKHQLCLGGVHDAGDRLNEYVLLGLLTEGQKRQKPFVTEGDLVILKIFGAMLDENNKRGEQREQIMLGLVEKVIFRDVNVNQLCAHNVELGKRRKSDSFSVKVILKTRKRKFSPDYNTLGELMQVSSVVTTLRQFRALECLPRNPLCRDILWPTNNETYCDTSTKTSLKIQSSFNPSQQKAIMTASLMVSRPSHLPKICLLQGPPGTGKSHTVLGIINQILEDKQKKARICLCAQSHAAIDELLRRLVRQNKQFKEKRLSTVKLVRIGKPSSVHEDVRYLCLENLIEKNVKVELAAEKQKQLPQSLLGEKAALEKKIQAVKADIKNSPDLKKKKLSLDLQKLERQKENLVRKCQVDVSKEKATPEILWKVKNNLIENAHIIAGTLSGIGGSVLKQYFEGGGKEKGRQGFDCIIIDEATQAIELDTLIPLQYGTTKLILVGDPEQLPPTVVSQVAVDNRFNLSMFERLNSHFRYSNYNPVIMLDTQYRMDPEICSFPSNYIYDGKLKTDRSIFGRSQCPLVPYLLYDIADGREQLSQCSGSVSNPVEALFTVRLVKFITENTNVTANVIGIIAPYQKQKSLLVTHLQGSSLNGLHEIEVSTVDGFQGREKHVIIMSCVRAKSPTGTIGFVGNRNRMNVSLTRAKYALYVIAHFDSLEKSDEWVPVIEDADKRKRRIPVTEQTVEKALAKCLKRNHQRPP